MKCFIRSYKKPALGYIFLLIINTGLISQSANLRVDYLTSDHGLCDHRVHAIAEDNNGCLWIATTLGVHKYDGENITQYKISENHFDLKVRENGNLYITAYSELIMYPNRDDKKIVWTKIPNSRGRNPFIVGEDRNIWVGTIQGKFYRFSCTEDTIKLAQEIHAENLSVPLKSVYAIYSDESNMIWLGCENGLYLLNFRKDSLLRRCSIDTRSQATSNIIVYAIHKDMQDNFWLGTSEGLKLIKPEALFFTGSEYTLVDYSYEYPGLSKLKEKSVYAIQSDAGGRLYLRTGDGIYATNRSKSKIDLLHYEDLESYGKYYGYAEYALEYTSQGILWFGTERGVGKINLNQQVFTIYQHEPENPNSLSSNKLNHVLKDNQGNLWVGTAGKGLNRGIYDKEYNTYRFENYIHNPNDPYSIHANNITRLYLDPDGIVWVGSTSIQRIDLSSGNVRFIYPEFLNTFPGKNTPMEVYYITADIKGNLFFTFTGCNIIYYPSSNSFDWFYIDKSKPYSHYMKFIMTGDGRQYLSSYSLGIYEIQYPLSRIDSVSVCPAEVKHLMDDDNLFSDHYFNLSIFNKEEYKDIWTPTFRNYHLTENKSGSSSIELHHAYNTKDDGRPYDYYDYILEDGQNRVWATTRKGLCCIDRNSKSVYNIYSDDGLPTNFFGFGGFRDSDGTFFLTTTNGLVSFHPDSVDFFKPPNIYIKSITVQQNIRSSRNTINQEKEDSEILIIEFPEKQIELPYFRNSFGINYVAIDYINSSLNKYLWTLRDRRRNYEIRNYGKDAVFANLRPGKYLFNVQASNHNNVWNTTGASLEITILPPPWLTWYAYIVYGLIALGIVLLYRRFLLRRARLKTALEIERVEKDKVLEMDQMKSRFFANISHEFRTPLTLILGPVEDLFRSKTESFNLTRDTLQMIRRNIKRLQRLINQLLDISRLETGNMKLMVAQGNITVFCRTIIQSFLSLAESKKINYEYHLSDPDNEQYYDADKLEKILTNLLSNAFKFTPEKGSITVNFTFSDSADKATAFAELSVKDTGIGIPGDQAEKIFDRFYQVSSSDARDAEGTGIGLSLTRELVELYRGEIKVESKPGVGSLFTVKIPYLKHQFKPEEFCDPEMVKDTATEFTDEIATQEKIPELAKLDTQVIDADESASLILVVEDNSDLRNYITEHLKQDHTLLEAENGKEGFNRAAEYIPDLIITDLMMPEMDGMEMCRLLKSDERTNHIPVIMLTAKADRESKLDGLKTGADDYLIKPFDAEELKIRVKNIILQRQKLREKFRNDFFAAASKEDQIAPRDQLIRKLFQVFEEHLDDADFDIEKLGSEINMSRAQVFRKINAVTGNTPKELLRNFRLQKAARLFSSGHDQITQVMLQVGFNNSSYFTKCFRELYGTTPSEYIKNSTKKSGI
jgi:signal transduction histidine kinase/DNA-binding response OmpR family regulator/ligand-binding sensor domain-containing protein